MRFLLDTHIAIWAVSNPSRLGQRAAALLTDGANFSFVSVVSLWEIDIKFRLRRGDLDDMPFSASRALREFEAAGFDTLDVTPSHILALEALPPLHRDPFDRMLVAQARSEPMRLLTSDGKMATYGDFVERV